MKCKTCGKNSESEFCFAHKPRKPLAKTKMSSKVVKKLDNHRNISDMNAFFLQIWNKKNKHECENCGKWLGKEPLSYMFDHLLEKSKYPELKYEEDNIMLVCLECHDNKTRGFLTDFVRAKVEEARKKFENLLSS
jgi:5-methylcytosine-specific restriction endonuclease McrA